MRYLLQIENYEEVSHRQKYLEQIFHVWFTIDNDCLGRFIVFDSFPVSFEKDICLIYGHNYEIISLLNNHFKEIPEKNIYSISCLPRNKNSFYVPNKKIFIAAQENNRVSLRHGADYGFDFDVCDTEINLYNLKGSISKKLSRAKAWGQAYCYCWLST